MRKAFKDKFLAGRDKDKDRRSLVPPAAAASSSQPGSIVVPAANTSGLHELHGTSSASQPASSGLQVAPPQAAQNFSEAQLFRGYGDTYSGQGNYNDAVVMYIAARDKSDPPDAELLLSLALARMMSSPPQLAVALADVHQVIERFPANSQAYSFKADICERMNAYDDAEAALQMSLQLSAGMDRVRAQQSLANVRAKRAQALLAPSPAAALAASPTPSPSPGQSPYGSPQPASASGAPPPPPPASMGMAELGGTVSGPPGGMPSDPTPQPRPATVSPVTASPSIVSQSTQPSPSLTTASLPTRSATTVSSNPTAEPAAGRPAATAPSSSTPFYSYPAPPYTPARTTPLATAATQRFTPAAPPASSARQPPAVSTTSPTATSSFTQPVQRSHTASNVADTPARNLPFIQADLFDDVPSEPPPGYTPRTGPAMNLSAAEIERRIQLLEQQLAFKSKGCLSIRPYTLPGKIDAIMLMYAGMTQAQLTPRELPKPTYLHPLHGQMAVNGVDYPGSTFIDQDPETSAAYSARIPGTCSVAGYSEEYRAHQLRILPMLSLQLEADVLLPRIDLDRVVARLKRVQTSMTNEDDEGLKELLGLSQVKQLQYGFTSTGTRQKRIDSLCMLLSKAHAADPTRFVDLRKASSVSGLFLTGKNQETTTRDFLYQLLLGAELLVRLRKQPVLTSYQGIMSDYTSTLIVMAAAFMASVSIQDLRLYPSTRRTFGTASTPGAAPPKYAFAAFDHHRQAEALIRFGEALAWPHMGEARDFIENAYDGITRGEAMNLYVSDWLFGMVLPGKFYRHRIMSCLVLASKSVRQHGPAAYYDNGVVIGNKSYWPARTVLARVLGGLRNPRSVCGWLGPLPAPVDAATGDPVTGWVLLYARNVDFAVPVTKSANALADFGFSASETASESPADIVVSLTNADEWIYPTPPSGPSPAAPATTTFKGIRLERLPPALTASATVAGLPAPVEYRASLDFDVAGEAVRYTLYSNPVFVTAPPCVGQHVVHRRQAALYLASTVTVAQLKETYPEAGKLLIINALGKGEEVVARAWCAERAKSAVVRRNTPGFECCFACACAVASGRTGLGVDVLIWSV